MTKAIRQDPDYPLIMINAADKQFKVANWGGARKLYELAMNHAACTTPRKAECKDMIQEIDRITTGGARECRLELIDIDKLSDIDRLKMFFDSTPQDVRDARYKELKDSIEKHGIRVPIDVVYSIDAHNRNEKEEIGDNLIENGWKILDGYTRIRIAKELGITQVKAFIHSAQFLKNEAKEKDEKGDPFVNYGLRLNVKRRQMTTEERDKVAKVILEGQSVRGVGGRPKKGDEKTRPDDRVKSGSDLAKEIGVSERTGRRILAKEIGEGKTTNPPKFKKINGLAQSGTLKQGADGDYLSNNWSQKLAFAMREFLNNIKELDEVNDRNIKEVTFKFEIALFKENA